MIKIGKNKYIQQIKKKTKEGNIDNNKTPISTVMCAVMRRGKAHTFILSANNTYFNNKKNHFKL
jgi:hypothetical protein